MPHSRDCCHLIRPAPIFILFFLFFLRLFCLVSRPKLFRNMKSTTWVSVVSLSLSYLGLNIFSNYPIVMLCANSICVLSFFIYVLILYCKLILFLYFMHDLRIQELVFCVRCWAKAQRNIISPSVQFCSQPIFKRKKRVLGQSPIV